MDRSRAGKADAASPEESILIGQAAHLFRQGRIPAAQRIIQEVLRRNPNNAEAHVAMGECLAVAGRPEEGAESLRRAVQLDRSNSDYLLFLADLLHQSMQCDESLECSTRVVERQPQNGVARTLVAKNLEQMHRIDDAARFVEESLELLPGEPHLELMQAHLELRRKKLDSADRRLSAMLDRDDLPAELEAHAHHERGMVLDRLGRYDEAFEHFRICGDLTASLASVSTVDQRAKYTQISQHRQGFTRELVDRIVRRRFDDDRSAPAFLVGFPRSGTTMTEQIMASHPDIETSGERPFLGMVGMEMARLIGSGKSVADAIARLSDADICGLRATYWEAVHQVFDAHGLPPIFVDKLPLNIIGLGLINVVFPESRSIVALRDPRDVCLSCFMQHFRPNNAMVQFLRLDETARFYEAVMDLYLHYRETLSLDMIEIRYEDTVTDLEASARRILSHLGASWDDQVLAFHEQARSRYIATPSYAAVTEEVYTRSMQRWRNYEEHIQPILPRLQRFIDEFGYD